MHCSYYCALDNMTTPSVRNVIFDVDGTLLDSKRDIAAAQLYVLKQFGLHHYTPEDIYPHIGKTNREIYEFFLPTQFHSRIPEAHEMYLSYYRPRALDTTRLFPGVIETLEKLYLQGIRLAVATTKSTMTTNRVIEHFCINQFFHQLQGTDGTPSKPDPFILNKIISEQAWQSEESMMVGDTDKDIEAGKNAGMRSCGVTYGAFTRPQMEKCKPDFIIDVITELPNLLFP
jgi:phosphoglycolate phosphatase